MKNVKNMEDNPLLDLKAAHVWGLQYLLTKTGLPWYIG